jgi:hypothetical protein
MRPRRRGTSATSAAMVPPPSAARAAPNAAGATPEAAPTTRRARGGRRRSAPRPRTARVRAACYGDEYIAAVFARIQMSKERADSEPVSGGWGWTLPRTAIVRRELPRLLASLDAQALLDAPCGDFNWLRAVDLGAVAHVGVDVVQALVERDRMCQGAGRQCAQAPPPARPGARRTPDREGRTLPGLPDPSLLRRRCAREHRTERRATCSRRRMSSGGRTSTRPPAGSAR